MMNHEISCQKTLDRANDKPKKNGKLFWLKKGSVSAVMADDIVGKLLLYGVECSSTFKS